MNKRIRELAEQAEMWKVVHFPHLTLEEEKCFEKFAELIVRECAGIYEAIDNGNEVAGTEDYLTALHNIYLGDKNETVF